MEVPPRPAYEYGEVSEPSPKRQKLNADPGLPQVVIHYQAQKEEAEVALAKFQDLLQEIFDAYDRLQPDTSASRTPQTSLYFEELDDALDETSARLATKIHSKLQNAIKKLATSKKFKDVPSDDVRRLQKICEDPILHAQTVNLHAEEDSTEDDVSHWRASISRAENGLTSACTLAWTILGSLETKELCPEDLVQSMPILLTNVFENCLIPVVEARSTGRTSALFKLASGSKDLLARLLHQGRKLLSLMADICLQMESAETAITRIEYLATQLIFVESSFTEKDSVLGVQLYETVRKTAMEALAKIFSKFVDQRQSILDEILSSLQKLSTTKQGARQFKLVDGKNIQLVSALVMQLVQTVATNSTDAHRTTKSLQSKLSAEVDAAADSDGEDSTVELSAGIDRDGLSAAENLGKKAKSLHQKAMESANYIINYFVQRAKVSTKSGDQPHRNLLDLFTEDLIGVLGSPEWPAAELLLWILARHMLAILNDEKSAATPKNMALELLGWMGSAISNLLVLLQSLCSNSEQQDNPVAQYLKELAQDQLRGSIRTEDILTETGPFRITLAHLKDRDLSNWQVKTARGYYLTVWAKTLSSGHDGEGNPRDAPSESLCETLLKALDDSTWLEKENALEDITPHQGRLAYLLTIINMNFCKTFDVIVKVLLQSLTSDQAKMRSRSLKSVVSMLEADPKLLDRDAGVMNVIFRCASDSSPMVRDNALSLIAKCMSLRPALEEEATRVILERGQSDVATGVRKRCIGILKDIYSRNAKFTVKAGIARAFLFRLNDPEEAVSLLAQQTLFEIWISPFLATTQIEVDTVRARVALQEQVKLIVKSVNVAESMNTTVLLSRLEQFYRCALEDGAKAQTSIFTMCSSIVDTLFDLILNNSDQSSKQEQRTLLSTLEAFARADSNLVKPEQLQALQPYIQSLSTDDDLFFFRSVVVIFRCVLPRSSDKNLLKAIQNDLMRAVSKLGRCELNEAIACLWTIDRVLRNTERLVKLTMSLLKNIHGTKIPAPKEFAEPDPTSVDVSRRLRSYLRIAGCVGKHCNLESFANSFREIFPSWKGTSVVDLMVDLIYPLTTVDRPPLIRSEALHSLASIFQTWPGQFKKEPVRRSFADVLADGPPDLQVIILTSFLDFFRARELTTTEILAASKVDAKEDDGGRLDNSLKASDHDGAAALIAQHFLSFVVRLSISGNEQVDISAIEVIASINRQGLVHPKECAGALVALETSPRPSLAEAAYESHRLLHQQHETMFEREYMRAIREAYAYQRDILHDPAGAKVRPFVPKLLSLYEIVKTSNIRYVRKFLRNLVTKISIDLGDIVDSNDAVDQLLFSRFIVQNLAYLDYGKVDELLFAISVMEGHVGKAGAEVAQALEAQGMGTNERLQDELQPPGESMTDGQATPSQVVEPVLLKHLTMAAMKLTMLWETRTHLRRQYGITGAVRDSNGKSKDAKDLAKAPTKAHGITGERYWDIVSEIMRSLENEDAMIRRCHAFAQLMAIDEEVKVAAEGDETRETYSARIEPEAGLQHVVNGGKVARGKRKSSLSVAGTPKKKRGRSSLNDKRRSSMTRDSDEGWD